MPALTAQMWLLLPQHPCPGQNVYKEDKLGVITNPARKLKIASVKIKGTEYLLREGDQAMGCKMKKIEAGKIVLVYKGKHITINKNSN